MIVRVESSLAREAAELLGAAANEWQQAKKDFVGDEGDFLDEHVERATRAGDRLEAAAADGVDPTDPASARGTVERLLDDAEALKDELREASGYLGPGRIHGERDLEEVQVAIAGIFDGISEVHEAVRTYYGDATEREA